MKVGGLLVTCSLLLQATGPTAPQNDTFVYQGSYYETENPGTALLTFGLGHLFNYDKVIAEYKRYFRADGPRSSKYKYKFDYADSISKQ